MRQVVPPTVIYQLPSALYRSSLELSPLDHSHMFAMYTPPLTRVCGALLQEATAVPGLHCSLCPSHNLSFRTVGLLCPVPGLVFALGTL